MKGDKIITFHRNNPEGRLTLRFNCRRMAIHLAGSVVQELLSEPTTPTEETALRTIWILLHGVHETTTDELHVVDASFDGSVKEVNA